MQYRNQKLLPQIFRWKGKKNTINGGQEINMQRQQNEVINVYNFNRNCDGPNKSEILCTYNKIS